MEQVTLPHPATPITDSGTKNEILLHIDIIPLLLLPTAAPATDLLYASPYDDACTIFYTLFQ